MSEQNKDIAMAVDGSGNFQPAEAGVADNVTNLNAAKRIELTAAEREVRWARLLAQHMLRINVHPVLVYGTHKSGKTTFLASLLGRPRWKYDTEVNHKVSLFFDEKAVLPPSWLTEELKFDSRIDLEERQKLEKRIENAWTLFNKLSDTLRNGERLSATQTDPFFIPVKTVFSDPSSHTVTFAFLEAAGESYDMNDSRFKLKPPLPEVQAILEGYTGPISVIFVAPCVADTGEDARDESHQSLALCMDQYKALRKYPDRDNLLLLYTKWDGLCAPQTDPDFSGASSAAWLDKVKDWNYALAKFAPFPTPPQGGKYVMPFAAAWVGEDGQVHPAGEHEDTFLRFNRTVWNWLYANSWVSPQSTRTTPSNIRGLAAAIGFRPVLYEDVVPARKPFRGWYASLTSLVLSLD